jgi:hypothetical protein
MATLARVKASTTLSTRIERPNATASCSKSSAHSWFWGLCTPPGECSPAHSVFASCGAAPGQLRRRLPEPATTGRLGARWKANFSRMCSTDAFIAARSIRFFYHGLQCFLVQTQITAWLPRLAHVHAAALRLPGVDRVRAHPNLAGYILGLAARLHLFHRRTIWLPCACSSPSLRTFLNTQIVLSSVRKTGLRPLCRRFDCYRVERTSSQAGLNPAGKHRLSRGTSRDFPKSYGYAPDRYRVRPPFCVP